MYKLTLTKQSKLLESGKISSLELTKLYLNRIKKYDHLFNCFISINEEHAIEQAKNADSLRSNQQHVTPLTGVPLAYKDNFLTSNFKTTCASKMLDNFIAPYESTVTRQLSDAGAVMLGKLNMDEFAMGSSTESSYYGATKNPWNCKCVPGGSSGGSAACIAAGLAAGTIGSDTGGSIRQPAAFCGISGIKPSYGRVSRWGLVAFASSLDQAGPMARSAEDLALMLEYMAGPDNKDSTSIKKSTPKYTTMLNNSIKGLKIGVPRDWISLDCDPNILRVFEEAINTFKSMGAIIRDVSLPNSDLAIPTYYVIASAEASSNLARFDGVHYGYRCDAPKSIEDLYRRSRSEAFGKEVKRRIMIGTYALSAGHYDEYYLKAQKIRRLIKNDFDQALNLVDAIISPTTPTTAFLLGKKFERSTDMYLADIFTVGVNLAGIPAINIPAGFIDQLPVGIQLIGKSFEEALLLNAAHAYQKETDWHQKMPESVI